METIEEDWGRETKTIWSTCVAFSCLETPALYILQGAGVELDSGEGGETENRGEEKRSSTHRPKVPWDSDRLEPQTLRRATRTLDTPKNPNTHYLFSSITRPHLFKNTGKRTYDVVVQCTPAECMGVMFVWNIFIPLWLHHSVLHNAPYHIHPIHLSLIFSTASGYTSHIALPSLLNLM